MNASSDLAVISVTTVNYLHRARALMQAAARHLPEARRIVCCTDSPVGIVDPRAEGFEVLDAAELALPRYRQLAFALNATGLCCALKPHVALHALGTGASRVLYLDNDIQLFRRPEEMLAALTENQLVLTPHLLGPVPPGVQPDEATVVAFGIFNAGMFAVSSSSDSNAFLRWWGARTLDPTVMHQATGYDQIWLNFAPVFLRRTAILRDEGYNVASWNIASRPLTLSADGFRAGAAPLTTFHFSSFEESQPHQLFAPYVKCNHRSGPVETTLAAGYAATLSDADQWRTRRYGFATFQDGRPISPMQRRVFATECWHETPPEADPFDPLFTTPRHRGWRSLHRYHELPVRAMRALNRVWKVFTRS